MSQEQHLHHAVAERLRTVATLIGTPASEPLVIDGEVVVPGLGLSNAEAQLFKRADRLQRGQVTIAALGAVSRGKSTLLNACLGAEVFPSGPEAVTGGICRIVYGDNPEEVTLVEEGGTRTMNRDAFNRFISLSSDEQPPIGSPDPWPLPERLKNLQQAVLHSDSSLCEQGLQFVDTLGFNAGPRQGLITQWFLRQTDAILMVLRTEPLFDALDVNVINARYQETDPGIGNMFFVANDFGTMSDEDKQVLMEETAPQRLRTYFTGADGKFDQALFDRRVFLVNAKAALDAKLAGATGDALEATGLPALESAFNRIIDEGEHLRIAIDAAVARTLLPSLAEAHTAIQRQRGLLDADAAALEPAVREAEDRLRELTQKAHNLRTTIERSGQQIGERAADHFNSSFVTRFITPAGRGAKPPWYEDWDSLEFGKLLSLKNVSHAAISKGKRDELATEMRDRLDQYFRQQLNSWEEKVTTDLQPDIEKMSAEIKHEVTDFVLQLDRIKETIASHRMSDEFVDMDKRRATKVAQIIFGIGTLDPNQLVGPMLESSWRRFFKRLVSTILAFFVAGITALLFGGPVGWVVLFAEIVLIYKGDRRSMLNRVRDKIGDEFRRAFIENGPEFQRTIETNLEQQFTDFAVNLQATLDHEIAGVQRELDTAVEKRRGGQAAIAEETARLETIGSLLTAQFEELSRFAYGRVLTPEEQRERVDRFLLTEDEDDA